MDWHAGVCLLINSVGASPAGRLQPRGHLARALQWCTAEKIEKKIGELKTAEKYLAVQKLGANKSKKEMAMIISVARRIRKCLR